MAPITTYTLAALTAFAVGTNAALQSCGSAQYDPATYTCYNGNTLCPIKGGDVTKLCGTACYSTKMYTCNSGVLASLPNQNGAFTLTASNPSAPFNGKAIHASGQRFYIGRHSAAYCPSEVPQTACGLNGAQTVFAAPTALDVEVPGGQGVFVQTNGTMAFMQAHSNGQPNYLSSDLKAFQNGAYIGPNGVDFKACPVGTNVWQVYANIPSSNLPKECIEFTAVSKPYSGAVGAWQYT